MVRVATGPIRWFLTFFEYRGIMLPPWGIFLLESSMDDEALIRHERCHWCQYVSKGFLRFYVGYVLLLIRYGYEKHPWEIEARAAERL